MAAPENRDPSPIANMDLALPAARDLALLEDMTGADPRQAAWARGECLKFLQGDATRLNLTSFALTQLPSLFFADPRVVLRLTGFSCEFNGLEALPRELAGCRELQTLDCNRNSLAELPGEFFAPGALPKLKRLYVSNNRLVQVPAAPRGSLPALEAFDCGENRLETLPEFEDGGLPALRNVIYSGNSLAALPASLGLLGALTYVSCNDNLLTGLPVELGRCAALRAVYFGTQRVAGAPDAPDTPPGMRVPDEGPARVNGGVLAAWLHARWAAAVARRRVKRAAA